MKSLNSHTVLLLPSGTSHSRVLHGETNVKINPCQVYRIPGPLDKIWEGADDEAFQGQEITEWQKNGIDNPYTYNTDLTGCSNDPTVSPMARYPLL
jgi:hypothetical protein